MIERTVKGRIFTIDVDGKQIRIEHILGKGKRCRVFAPPGVLIETVPSSDAIRPKNPGVINPSVTSIEH